jgi:hypothetical protein
MSARRSVLIHRCKPQTDDGLPFDCACTRRVTSRVAHALVARGRGRWKRQRMAGDRIVEVHSEIILRERVHPLHARTISAPDIEHAWADGHVPTQKRIEEFGNSGNKHGERAETAVT